MAKKLIPTKAKLRSSERTLGKGYSLVIQDSDPGVSLGSRAELYWQEKEFEKFYLTLRPGLKLPAALNGVNGVPYVIKTYNLAGIGFGRWLTNEDKFNYTNALYIALYDFRKVLGFGANIGFGALNVTFGARGRGRAMAHYEPWSDTINITRYSRDAKGDFGQGKAFVNSGGISALAHEYGHFLDYFAGTYFEKSANTVALSGGRAVSSSRQHIGQDKTSLKFLMDEIMDVLIWENRKRNKHTKFYATLLKLLEGDEKKGEYWIRRNEIFARFMEVYTEMVLGQTKVKNKLLIGTMKYYEFAGVYPPRYLVERAAPMMKKFLSRFKGYINEYNL
jgi:hypothetical protein